MTFSKFINTLVDSNIYISLAAVALTLQTQVQLSLEPQLHPYIFIIFFGTFLEYNFFPFLSLLRNNEFVNYKKYVWINTHVKTFYIMMAAAFLGFLISISVAQLEVLMILSPLVVITLFYSIPLQSMRIGFPQLRQLPYFKVFLIALVWALVTILLPVVYLKDSVDIKHVILMIVERFVFVLAITIPFDIRDMEIDRREQLKTIPLLIGENRSIILSLLLICFFLILAVFHYIKTNQSYLVFAMTLSAISTFGVLVHSKTRRLSFYHNLILDGTILFQGILTLLCDYINS